VSCQIYNLLASAISSVVCLEVIAREVVHKCLLQLIKECNKTKHLLGLSLDVVKLICYTGPNDKTSKFNNIALITVFNGNPHFSTF